MNRVIRSVSFNLNDSYEKDLYEYVLLQSKYFSKHIKLLIDRDRSGGTQPVAVVVEDNDPVEVKRSDIKKFL